MRKNIKYISPKIADYHANFRIKWEEFYESEKIIIQGLGIKSRDSILDIGCGCGGLGLVLKEKFGTTNYTGIEISELAAHKAEVMNPSASIICGDFLEISQSDISEKVFDIVFSLSCFDWNTQFDEMLLLAWNHVAQGGSLIASFRIVAVEGCDDMKRSYQYINFDGELIEEKASYVVLNAKELFAKLEAFSPSSITAYGYFGIPSETAITPYEEICFTTVSVTKRSVNNIVQSHFDLQLPNKILSHLDSEI